MGRHTLQLGGGVKDNFKDRIDVFDGPQTHILKVEKAI